jgi:hypothetical protein
VNGNCSPAWVALLSALLTPAIALLAGIIAYRQWRTAHYRLKLDLFDQRLAIHIAVHDVLSSVMTQGKVGNDQLAKFLAGIGQTRWLLNEATMRYFDKEIWPRLCDLQSLEATLESLPVGPDRSDNLRQQREIRNWIMEQLRILDARFDKFLKMTT